MQDQTEKDSGRVSERQRIIRVLGGLFIGLVLVLWVKDAVREERQAEIRARMAAYEERTEAQSGEPAGVILAVWEADLSPTIRMKNTLVHQVDRTLLTMEFSDGSSGSREVIERPPDRPNERRFELEPESDRSEYITLTGSGLVKYFSWEGRQFMNANTTSIHVDFLTVGAAPVERECVPRELSAHSKEIVQLYEELRSFKDTSDFAFYGFGPGGSYGPWLETAQRLHAESGGLKSLDELGFLAGDVMTLGLDYMSARRRAPSQYAEDMERTIHTGLARATCDAP